MLLPAVNPPQRKRDYLAHITVPAAVAAHIVNVTEPQGTFPVYLPLLIVSIATAYHILFIGVAINKCSTEIGGNAKRKKARISKRTRQSTKKHIERVRMCKSVVVSETTLKNYNSLIKDHIQLVAKNHSTIKYQEGLTIMEFHGRSTLVSILKLKVHFI